MLRKLTKTVKLLGTPGCWSGVRTLIGIVVAALLVFSFAGCADPSDDNPENPNKPNTPITQPKNTANPFSGKMYVSGNNQKVSLETALDGVFGIEGGADILLGLLDDSIDPSLITDIKQQNICSFEIEFTSATAFLMNANMSVDTFDETVEASGAYQVNTNGTVRLTGLIHGLDIPIDITGTLNTGTKVITFVNTSSGDTASFSVTETVIVEHTVTFDKNGGDTEASPPSVNVRDGKAIKNNMPQPPALEFFAFMGWNTEPDGDGDAFTADTLVDGDITVYAQWEEINDPRTVTFDKNGGDSEADPSEKVVNLGRPVVALPAEPTRVDHVFKGWNTEPDGEGTAFLANTSVNDNITVYAQWNPVYTVSFDINGATGSTPESMNVERGDTVVLPLTAGERAGYAFIGGWNTEPDGNGEDYTHTTPITKNITLYAKWVKLVSVTFSRNGATGTTAAITHIMPGSTVTLPTGTNPAGTRSGYVFRGWNTKDDGSGTEFTAETPVTEDITVFAKWVQTFGVTFNRNGGNGTAAIVQVANGEAIGASLPTAAGTRTGYRFLGTWNTAQDGSGEPFTAETIVTGAITVYAQWLQQVGVTFNRNGATGTATVVYVDPGQAIGTNAAFTLTRTGYRLAGWNTVADGSGTLFTTETELTAAITIYAQWVQIYTVTFNRNGGEVDASPTTRTVDQGAAVNTVELPIAPAYTHYTFTGWNTAANGTGSSFTAETPVTATITVYAQWQRNEYTVTFSNGGGTTTNPVQIPGGDPLGETFPEEPTWAGHGFRGWYTGQNGGGEPFTAKTPVTGTITVYAWWHTYSPGFVPVTNITLAKTALLPGQTLTLTPTASPSNATKQTIIWSLAKGAEETKGSLSGNTFTAGSATGVVTVIATITGGGKFEEDYVQRYGIAISKTLDENGDSPNFFLGKRFISNTGSNSNTNRVSLNNATIILGMPASVVDDLLAAYGYSSFGSIIKPMSTILIELIFKEDGVVDMNLNMYANVILTSVNMDFVTIGDYKAYIDEDDVKKVRISGLIAELGPDAYFDITGTLNESNKELTIRNTDTPNSTTTAKVLGQY